ncbi:MAG: hypothetical protein KGZ58_01115 [Ignavibacteriales bacterium]|nr:hypothetical protein [Ignavibacteriales bacterium]
MSVNNLQQTRHNRQELIYNLQKMSFTDDFANWLENAYQNSRFKSYAALGKAAGGLSRSTIASLAKAKPQTATNKASRPKRENVIAIAKALNADIDKVLQIAGHAPINLDEGFYRIIDKFSPRGKRMANKQIKAILETIAEDEGVEPDFDYGTFGEEKEHSKGIQEQPGLHRNPTGKSKKAAEKQADDIIENLDLENFDTDYGDFGEDKE